MRVFGLSGCETDAAIDLVTAILPTLRARDVTVSVLLEGPADFDLDRPGKDSYAHRAAGALEVAISSTQRWALLHEEGRPIAPRLSELTAHFGAVDLVLVVGFEAAFREALQEDSAPGVTLRPLQLGPDPKPAEVAAFILEDLAGTPSALTQQA